ncbi:MAG: hypothetical protein MO853_12080 [Candidatus Protistobacter heckmanni]|nr:hypothetical protein [Candidatus Protistobacter heckmanni]
MLAQRMLKRLWNKTSETVALFVRQGDYRICAAELPNAQPLSFKRGVGSCERIVLGASGRVMLAFESLQKEELEASARGLDLDLAAIERELAQIRRRGYAVSRNALIQGAVAVAAPFFDGAGRLHGALGVFGPSVRVLAAETEAFGQQLIEECAALSRALSARAGAAARDFGLSLWRARPRAAPASP